jgi:diguanylate cyclase (GGDEF)-like protein
VTLVDDAAAGGTELSGQLYEPWLFLSMLQELSANEAGIGFIYSVLDLLARRYQLSDAVVVLGDEVLGTQAFRLGRRGIEGSSLAKATGPGVYTAPDVVPDLVREVVRSMCQLSLTLHLARYATTRDPFTNVANRSAFDAALRTASVQSSRYGWPFALVLIDLLGAGGPGDDVGHTKDDQVRFFGRSLRRSVRGGDTAARLGTDQFAVILWNAEMSGVFAFAERLQALLVSVGEMDFVFGIATAPRDATDAGELQRIAQTRLVEKRGVGRR